MRHATCDAPLFCEIMCGETWDPLYEILNMHASAPTRMSGVDTVKVKRGV